MNKLNLQNLKRCNQVWEDMTPNEKGRLCQKCDKTIIDFRQLTDNEVAEKHIFKEGPICGIYTEKQLEPPSRVEVKKTKFVIVKSMYLSMAGLLSTTAGFGQEVVDTITVVQTERDVETLNEGVNDKTEVASNVVDTFIVAGQIVAPLGQLLIGGSVLVKGTTTGAVTGFDGKYRLSIIEKYYAEDQVTLVFSYIGFATKEVVIQKAEFENKDQVELDVMLEDSMLVIGFGITARPPWYKRVWYRVRNVFRK